MLAAKAGDDATSTDTRVSKKVATPDRRWVVIELLLTARQQWIQRNGTPGM